MFTIDDLGQSSTFRLSKAISYVLLSFVEHLKQKTVKVFIENQSAASIVFGQDWSGETTGSVLPVGLVVNAVRVLTACSGRGTLIIAEWPSASFWPLLRDGPSWFKSFVSQLFLLPAVNDLILEGPVQRQIYVSPVRFPRSPKIRV